MITTMNRSDFLEARRSGIGGSDIGAILGLSPYKTAYDVFLDKTASVEHKESDSMYWGTVLEDVVASEYQKRSSLRVQRVKQLLRHPEHNFAIANIDRAIINPEIAGNVRWKNGKLTTDRILECKTANGFAASEWGDPGTDFVPDTYLLQCQWYLGITDTQVADLAVLIGGNDYRTFTIARDDSLFSDLLAEAETFWNNCQKGIAPDPQNVHDAARMWPHHIAGKSVIVDVEVAWACERLDEVNTEIKSLGTEADELKRQIMTAFGNAEEITHQGIRLATWKNQTSNRLDSMRLHAERPDIVAEYTKTTESRVLRLSKRGKK